MQCAVATGRHRDGSAVHPSDRCFNRASQRRVGGLEDGAADGRRNPNSVVVTECPEGTNVPSVAAFSRLTVVAVARGS